MASGTAGARPGAALRANAHASIRTSMFASGCQRTLPQHVDHAVDRPRCDISRSASARGRRARQCGGPKPADTVSDDARAVANDHAAGAGIIGHASRCMHATPRGSSGGTSPAHPHWRIPDHAIRAAPHRVSRGLSTPLSTDHPHLVWTAGALAPPGPQVKAHCSRGPRRGAMRRGSSPVACGDPDGVGALPPGPWRDFDHAPKRRPWRALARLIHTIVDS